MLRCCWWFLLGYLIARLSAKAKEQGSRFYQASISTAASTAEGIKRLALGEPLQVWSSKQGSCCCFGADYNYQCF